MAVSPEPAKKHTFMLNLGQSAKDVTMSRAAKLQKPIMDILSDVSSWVKPRSIITNGIKLVKSEYPAVFMLPLRPRMIACGD